MDFNAIFFPGVCQRTKAIDPGGPIRNTAWSAKNQNAQLCGRSVAWLFAQFKLANQIPVLIDIGSFQIIEQLAPLADHFQQSPARMVILDMSLEVIGKPIDTCRQKSDLNFRGPGVARSTPMFRNDSSLLLNGNRHFVIISVNSKGKSLS